MYPVPLNCLEAPEGATLQARAGAGHGVLGNLPHRAPLPPQPVLRGPTIINAVLMTARALSMIGLIDSVDTTASTQRIDVCRRCNLVAACRLATLG